MHFLSRLRDLAHLSPRIVAGVWFALAVLICLSVFISGSVYSIVSGEPGLIERDSLINFVLLPFLAAGISGMIWGYQIFGHTITKDRAIRLGAETGCIAYLIYTTLGITMLCIKDGDVLRTIYSGAFIFGIGALFTGLPILTIGGTAGWLLYRFTGGEKARETITSRQ